jgi:hypothetical protein
MAVGLVSSVGFDLFGVTWETTMQRRIDRAVLARVASYDWLGSLLAMPLGMALTGTIAGHAGVDATLVGATALSVLAVAAMLSVGSVRNLTNEAGPGPEPGTGRGGGGAGEGVAGPEPAVASPGRDRAGGGAATGDPTPA